MDALYAAINYRIICLFLCSSSVQRDNDIDLRDYLGQAAWENWLDITRHSQNSAFFHHCIVWLGLDSDLLTKLQKISTPACNFWNFKSMKRFNVDAFYTFSFIALVARILCVENLNIVSRVMKTSDPSTYVQEQTNQGWSKTFYVDQYDFIFIETYI